MKGYWEQELTEEQISKMVCDMSDKIVKKGLAVPGIAFLELHKPLANVSAHMMIMASPLYSPFLGFEVVDQYSQFFRSRDNIERLICALEDAARKPAKEASA